ncbi:helix-turn-helix domain-containing protein [Carnobacterium maltaromaticum]|uniref:helix-turn-helix domain-containing protein n=1 Tax=Carnobacterium maltaromaticum TaxID=2751 RepID=UPI0007051425|nr:helix-turn-helix domain-containing protein [Carnobacterium maltaromaticum]KRN71838.1 hypothetical protein IV76_GL003357 [Carnobacterium maltaromaticum]MBC9810189.1 hypothetical protein [Carnobacterium maltaromaticum]CRH17890.1 conserved hypothetical protein [Carnobacterium maltaromaticum]
MEVPKLLEIFGEGIGRQMLLFSMLFDKEPLTRKKLEVLPYSFKTLQSDLEQLAEILKKWDGEIRLSKYYNASLVYYKLEREPFFAPQTVIFYICQKTLEFKILELFLYGNLKKVHQFLLEHGIGYTTYYRVLRKIRGFLYKYGISINTNSLELVGKESEIRLFYFQFLWTLCEGLGWPFKNSDEKKMIEKADIITKKQRVGVIETRKLTYWLAICEMREDRKCNVRSEEIPDEIIKLTKEPIYENLVEALFSESRHKIGNKQKSKTESYFIFWMIFVDYVTDVKLDGASFEQISSRFIQEFKVTSIDRKLYNDILKLIKWEVNDETRVSGVLLLHSIKINSFISVFSKERIVEELRYFITKFSNHKFELILYDRSTLSLLKSEMKNLVAKIQHIKINIFLISKYGDFMKNRIVKQLPTDLAKQVNWLSLNEEISETTIIFTDSPIAINPPYKKIIYFSHPVCIKEIEKLIKLNLNYTM